MKTKEEWQSSDSVTALLFDLDGTLIDSVYQHVLAWRELEKAGAYRVYDDPLDLLNHLDEVGVRTRPSVA